ncbi:TPA: fimbrial usher protein StbD [Citrobacter amalonaticus]|uniref:fimbrial usher protein StbD n=1 Tax=Citrobacter TaxID=544 RepID=UPI0015EAB228|nr:fimbrial usher protein StbD [Citrobacter sp. RHB35-C17]QMD63580.1 fimbrial usher protein StbD [Citrobacter sp. RHB35-C17]HEM7865306.1 fimbrial usher protein StbD [Citrobacter amalonaticus]
MKLSSFFPLLLVGVVLAQPAWSACKRVTSANDLSQTAKDAGYIGASWGGVGDSEVKGKLGLPGVITLSSGAGFQTEGTLLASSTASFVPNGRTQGVNANQIYFRCDVAEIGKVYEYYATNGDDAWGGREAVAGIEGAYYTYVKNVALRLTNLKTGQYYSRYWQTRLIPENEMFNDGTYIYIPGSAFSDVFVELFRVDDASKGVNGSNRYGYTYAGPAGYIAFHGGGMSSGLFDGADSRTNYDGWGAMQWPGGWTLTSQSYFVRGAACRIDDYPAIVRLPPISVGELSGGGTAQTPFNITVECETGAISGTAVSTTSKANVAMGFLVNNQTAANAANQLGLKTGSGAWTWLLDNHYGVSGVASGVGIRIYSEKLGGSAINLLPNLTSTATGNTGGWYGYADLTSKTSTSGSTELYNGEFTASLEAIPGEAITAGSVYAQLQVVVSFQ